MNISDSNPNEKPRGLCINVMKHAYSMNIELTQPQMEDVMRTIMNGEATDAQIGALMMGLRL